MQLNVLIVENDPALSNALEDIIGSEGFSISLALGTEEALRRLATEPIALTLFDADADPQAVALRRLCEGASPYPVGALTSERIREPGLLAAGAKFVLRKPFGMEALLGVVSAHTVSAPASPEHVRTIAAYFRALSTHDWEGLAALCTEEVIYHLPGEVPGFSQRVVGRRAFAGFSAQVFAAFEGADFRVDSTLALPAAVLVTYTGSWQTPSGRQTLPGAVIFRFEGSAIAEIGVRLEAARLLESAMRSERRG